MEDNNKTIDQLIKELAGTREQIAELEKVVTELKKDEKILKENEEKYHRFFTTAPTAWAYQKLIVDENEKPVDYVFLEVNYAFEKMTGLKKENIIGKSVTEVLPGTEKEPADWLGKYGEVALTGKTLKFENYSAALNKWFFVSASSTEQGFFTTVFEDITERKEAEMALAESKDKFRGLVETTSDWIWEVNE